MPANLEQPEANTNNLIWYLGIDFGTTGISAVLLNYSSGQRYPIYWLDQTEITHDELAPVTSQLATRGSGEKLFRLPAVTYSGSAASELFIKLPDAPVVGSLASTLAKKHPGIFLENFKPYLNIGIPYYCSKHHQWEPTLQLSNQQLVSLYWVRRALQALLETLTPKSTLADCAIEVGAVGLKRDILVAALGQLEGVILGYPAAWGDTYHLNLREAVLAAKLVRRPEQIYFLEDAIAPILAGLPTSVSKASTSSTVGELENSPDFPITYGRGGTLVLNLGATTTEIALVDLPDHPQNLTYSDFSAYSLPYAGNAIAQDIFCQLLYPQLSEAQHKQLSFSRDLELPLPGQPDLQKRDRLVFQLQSSPLGQALLKASSYLKLILQHKEVFTLELGTDQWVVKRHDLEVRVIQPFIQQLNRLLKELLIKTGMSEQGIYQVFCIGGTATLEPLQKWLQQSLPLATLIQNSDSSAGSWVAVGLATLPLYPQVLNRLQQQYSNYFLLLELLRVFPEPTDDSAVRSYSIKEIVQQLERRGLNTEACYERIIRLVEGELPSGLVPLIENHSLLSETSKQNQHYLAVTSNTEIFSKEDDRRYRLNPQQQKCLRKYLEVVLSGTYQKFEEPLIVHLGQTF
jgi:hypothetical protein